jgi:hypothetical protein
MTTPDRSWRPASAGPSAASLVAVLLLASTVVLSASVPIGFYGLIDNVVFEPNEAAAVRVQVWGSFAYVERAGLTTPSASGDTAISAARRGYLYFRVSDVAGDYGAVVRREWADLKSVAGTGQGVGFGRWLHMGGFGSIHPDAPSPFGVYAPSGARLDLRVRPSSEPVANPIDYLTNAGVVKISEASHAAVLKALREAK